MRQFVILILTACLLLPSCVTTSNPTSLSKTPEVTSSASQVVFASEPTKQPVPVVEKERITVVEEKSAPNEEKPSPAIEVKELLPVVEKEEVYTPVKEKEVVTVDEPKSASDYSVTQSVQGVTATHGAVVTERLEGLEIPSYVNGHPVVAKLGYSLSYNLEYVQADWVAYVLTQSEVESESVGRSDKFYEETDVIKSSAHLSDYKKSGYDRGHLLSSADRNSSEELNQSTFSLLNMSPQIHRFNAGLFLKAEKAERDAAVQYGILFIVSGPIFTEDMVTIGECDVAVPKYFFKVFLGQDENGEWHAIGLIMPQEYENGDLKPYFVTVDFVEEVTGIDFYPTLENEIEIVVEAEYDTRDWPGSFK